MSTETLPTVVEIGSAKLALAPVRTTTVDPVNEPEAGGFSYKTIHQMLRGNYGMALSLGLLLALVAGLGAWYSAKPQYRSEALIRISYEIPRLNNSDNYRPMEAFEAFVQSQIALISSSRLVGEALRDPAWSAKGYKVDPANPDGFASDLKVEHKGGTEHVKISYVSTDPQFAGLAVQTVVQAYTQLYNKMDQQENLKRLGALEGQREDLRKRMEKAEAQLRIEAQEFGSANIDRLYDAAVQRLTKVESALIDTRIALALTQGAPGKNFPSRLTPQQIGRVDSTMSRYLSEREQLEAQLEQLRLRGYGESHKQVLQAKGQLEMVTARIRDYAMSFEGTGPVAAIPGVPALKSAEELKVDQTNLTALNDEMKKQMASLGGKKLNTEAIRSELDKAKSELAEKTQQLMSLQAETGLGGRMSVMSSGEVPLLPFRDRRAQMASAGALGGFVIPAAVIGMMTASRRRYRYSDDAAQAMEGEIPLLGILPQLPARLTDPEYAADAAQCVHQIRVMLQVQHQQPGAVAYLITSACPGEGKTSLTAALALSFAAAGAKTLLIDADLIGQRLTRGYQFEEREGFRELINGQEVTPYPTQLPNLWMIPAGISDGRDACAVGGRVVRQLLNEMRKNYDVLLIDSGPILGSLEALVMAGQVDGVVLTISREQQKPLVDRAIRQLKSVGARIAGMVFNKAQSWDFRRSVGASSLRSISRNSEKGLIRAGVTNTSGFGSLVDSVQTYMPD